jgi:hypothetical protein
MNESHDASRLDVRKTEEHILNWNQHKECYVVSR